MNYIDSYLSLRVFFKSFDKSRPANRLLLVLSDLLLVQRQHENKVTGEVGEQI